RRTDGTAGRLSIKWIYESIYRYRVIMPKMSHIEITRLQGGLAIASFVSGVVIAMVCLFWIEPLGEITYSAISIVSELLVLCGAILGVKASYDIKFHKFEAELLKKADKHE
ncbi:MAG: hypothetical protein J6C92_09030, partial [Bacteroidaceae bacterium]|nr:hypothetical protein [Bacteroidaceae bacterium]